MSQHVRREGFQDCSLALVLPFPKGIDSGTDGPGALGVTTSAAHPTYPPGEDGNSSVSL